MTLFLFSCQNEENVQDLPNTEDSLDQTEEFDGSKSVSIGGTIYKAGYGYGYDSRRNLRPFRPAIDEFSFYSTTDLNAQTEVSVQIVNNYEELRDFIKKGDSVGTDINLKEIGFSFGLERVQSIAKDMNFDSRYVNIVAKIKIPTQRWLADEDPFIDYQALSLLENGQYGRFFGRYGPGFVSDVLYGGDVYYTYTYDTTNLSEIEKTSLRFALSIGVLEVFKLGIKTSLTTEEKRIIKKSYTTSSVTTNVPEFNPGFITNWEDSEEFIEAKQDELRQFLINNPDKAPVIKRTVIEWDPINMYDLQQFGSEFSQQLAIYKSLNGN